MFGGEPSLVLELAESGLRFPGGHEALLRDRDDEGGALGRVLVREQGERSDFAGAVAERALRVQDGSDVAVLGWGGREQDGQRERGYGEDGDLAHESLVNALWK